MVCVTEAGDFRFRLLPMLVTALVVGVVGGAYGIGGGAIMAPICIGVLRLPPFLVAGAALLSTWLISVVGALMYAFLPLGAGVQAAPDWLLGLLYGIGGMAGVYIGARLMGRVPAVAVKLVLGLALAFIALRYLSEPVLRCF